MPLDATHQHSSADIMDADNPHTPISPGGSTPTLAEVLVAGNTVADANLFIGFADAGAAKGGRLAFDAPADNPNGYGGNSYLTGGPSPNNIPGARIELQGGENDAAGLQGGVYVHAAGGSAGGGTHMAGVGQILMGSPNPDVATGVMNLANIYSQAAGAPGATLTTLFYGDTTAVTGGLYVWAGSAYAQVGGPLP